MALRVERVMSLMELVVLLSYMSTCMGCSSKMELNDSDQDAGIQGNDRIHFPVTDSGIPEYPFKMSVFGIPMFASSAWSEEKLNHVSSILAELLDQDEDGCADDQSVLKEITTYENGGLSASALLPTLQDDVDSETERIMRKAGYFIATVEAEDETIPECSGLNFTATCCDASIEELFHLVTSLGHSNTYPNIFGFDWDTSSNMTDAVDLARGGRFLEVPNKYPSSAWYTYYDKTCEYTCQGVEYLWWGYCAYSGVCEGRSGAERYESEFRYLTKSEFEAGDVMLSKIFQDSGELYTLPTNPVDGRYYGSKTCPDGPDHGGD